MKKSSRIVICPSLVYMHMTEMHAHTVVIEDIIFSGTLYAWGMGTSNQLAQAEDDDVFEPAEMMGKQLQER